MQRLACPKLDLARLGNQDPLGQLAPTLKIVEQFYSKNGVPIEEDKTYDYGNRYTAYARCRRKKADKMRGGVSNRRRSHFDREPRFYADISVRRGEMVYAKWYLELSMRVGDRTRRRRTCLVIL